MRPLVLASTSPYRQALLGRLGLPFEVARPDADETPLPGEQPQETATRLAINKARAVAARFPDALIIGSDQVAAMGNQRFGKPGSRDAAIAQLRAMSGHTLTFHTAVALLDTRSGSAPVVNVPTEVSMRRLSDADIARYVDREPAFDCAGSAKSEGLGISLMTAVRGDDPNALVGLPLIALCTLLRDAGIELP